MSEDIQLPTTINAIQTKLDQFTGDLTATIDLDVLNDELLCRIFSFAIDLVNAEEDNKANIYYLMHLYEEALKGKKHA